MSRSAPDRQEGPQKRAEGLLGEGVGQWALQRQMMRSLFDLTNLDADVRSSLQEVHLREAVRMECPRRAVTMGHEAAAVSLGVSQDDMTRRDDDDGKELTLRLHDALDADARAARQDPVRGRPVLRPRRARGLTPEKKSAHLAKLGGFPTRLVA